MEPNETMDLPENVGVDSAGNLVDLGDPIAPLLSTSLLEMWSAVLSNIDAEQAAKISPQAAMGVLSKWPTLTRLMLTYRAGTFFARVHAPGLLLGLRTADEVGDIGATGQGNQAAAVELLLEADQ